MKINTTFAMLALCTALASAFHPSSASAAVTAAAAGCETRAQLAVELMPRHHMAIASNGDVISTGCEIDGTALRYVTTRRAAATGALLWSATYSAGTTPIDTPENRGGTRLVIDAAGDVVVAGVVANNERRLVKYSGATGVELWNVVTAGDLGFEASLAAAANGDVFLLSERVVVRRFAAATGAVAWSVDVMAQTPNTLAWDSVARELAVDASGDLRVFGFGRDPQAGPMMARLSGSTGQVQWVTVAGNASNAEIASGLALDAAGNAYGSTTRYGSPSQLGAVVKFTANGVVAWSHPFNLENLFDLRADAAGDVLVAGSQSDAGFVAKLSATDGTQVWRHDDSAGDPSLAYYALAVDGLDVVATGARASLDSARDIRTVRLAGANGALQWSRRLGPAVFDQTGMAVATDGDGNVVVGGGGSRPDPNFAMHTLKYAADGTPLWSAAYPAGFPLLAPGVDTDGDGIPNDVEAAGQGVPLDPRAKDNDVFGSSRLFVMQLYRDFLGREGDEAGIGFHAGQVAAGSDSRAARLETFLASPEFQNGLPQVTRLYLSFFNRIPDYAGLVFQVGQYRAGVPLAAIAQNFSMSPEFTSTYGSLTDEQYVDLVYQNVLGRPADAGGRQYYLDRLGSGALTRGQMMVGFSESPEFQQLVQDELFVMALYGGLLRRMPEPAGVAYYVDLLANGTTARAIEIGFIQSAEYRARFLP